MTDAEKKRMLQILRATEMLYSECLALKSVLRSRGVSRKAWEKECARLMSDPELAPLVHVKFEQLYAEIEQARDEAKAVEELLQALPVAKKPLN
jgi:hypothetical protein